MEFLKERGIQTGIHYPIPVHLQEAYADIGYKRGDLPVSELVANEVLSLPMCAELDTRQVEDVAGAIRTFSGTKAR